MSQVPLEEVINLTWIFETLMMGVLGKKMGNQPEAAAFTKYEGLKSSRL